MAQAAHVAHVVGIETGYLVAAVLVDMMLAVLHAVNH